MGTHNRPDDWERQLAQEGLPDHIGYEAQRFGGLGQRVRSLDVYPDLRRRRGH